MLKTRLDIRSLHLVLYMSCTSQQALLQREFISISSTMHPTLPTFRHSIMLVLEECRPATLEELSQMSPTSSNETLALLRKHEELHHMVLYQDGSVSPTPIAMMHLFSHL